MGAKKGEIDAFLAQAVAFHGAACFPWPFARNSAGYGHFRRGGKGMLAHRAVCEAVHGPAPEGKNEAAHLCGNGHQACVNPMHLAWKSRQGNAKDMIDHGRAQTGDKHWAAKLNADAVKYIRANVGKMRVCEMAKELNVSHALVCNVIGGKSWRWVE